MIPWFDLGVSLGCAAFFCALAIAHENKSFQARLREFRNSVRAARFRRAARKARIDINKSCPGCGHRVGMIRSDTVTRQIVHNCLICGAKWAEPYIIHPTVWMGTEG